MGCGTIAWKLPEKSKTRRRGPITVLAPRVSLAETEDALAWKFDTLIPDSVESSSLSNSIAVTEPMLDPEIVSGILVAPWLKMEGFTEETFNPARPWTLKLAFVNVPPP